MSGKIVLALVITLLFSRSSASLKFKNKKSYSRKIERLSDITLSGKMSER